MPVATVTITAVRKELKTAPPDGYVELIPLPFGKLLYRRDRATKMSMQQQSGGNRAQRRNRRQQQSEEETQSYQIELANEWSRHYEFMNCIVGHNLTDANGELLDFKNKMAFQMLDPKIGQEIEEYLDEINREEEVDEEDFPALSSSVSKDESPVVS